MTTIQPKDIILESALLSTMSHKENFTVYVNSIDKKRLLPATSLLLTDYEKYFKLFPDHLVVDFGQFQTQFTQNWHNKDLDQLDIEYYRDYVFPAIQKAEGTEHCLLGLMNKQTTDELLEVAISNFEIGKLREILDKHESKEQLILLDHDNEAITSTTVDLSVLDKSNGIPYFLPSLQASLGGLVLKILSQEERKCVKSLMNALIHLSLLCFRWVQVELVTYEPSLRNINHHWLL